MKRAQNIEDVDRPKAFTPGWSQSLDLVDSLPIKTHTGKVVRSFKIKANKPQEITFDDDEIDNGVDDGDISEEGSVNNEPTTVYEQLGFDSILMEENVSLSKIKVEIADICSSILTNPPAAISKGKSEYDPVYKQRKIWELFKLLEEHPNSHVTELAMLSILLLIKDICPSYYIRNQAEAQGVELKKETKSLLDHDKNILKMYQRYLRFLEKSILALGSKSSDDMSTWSSEMKFGLSALRCMCELLRALPFFNFRSQLLKAVVLKASISCGIISNLCTDTLAFVFKNDINGEVSFEAVRLMATLLVNVKYQVPENFLVCLENVKLSVHADQAKEVRQKVKKEKRKRKRATDEVLDGLAEADLYNDKLSAQRFQADCLHEICLIYFRVVKMKIGFELLPVALKGLSKISHLINVETVEDLVALMKTILDNPAVSITSTVKLLCIHCALKTLSGPGEILEYDSEIFVNTLLELLSNDIYGEQERWDIILDSIDLILVKRRELRNNVVVAFVRMLFCHIGHITSSTTGCTILCMINTVLLRYPRARSSIKAIGLVDPTSVSAQEDEVADYAMAPLQPNNKIISAIEEDGSWICTLLSKHIDSKLRSTVHKVVSKSIVNALPFRISELHFDMDTHLDIIDSSLQSISTKHFQSSRNKQATNGHNKSKKSSYIESKKSRGRVSDNVNGKKKHFADRATA